MLVADYATNPGGLPVVDALTTQRPDSGTVDE